MQRREVLLGSGTVAAVSLLGYANAASTDDTAADEDGGGTAAPSDLDTVLELVPAESALDASYQRLHYASVEEVDENELDHETRRVLDDLDAIESDSVSTVSSVHGENGTLSISAMTGSFDRPEAGDATGEDGDWRIAELDDGDAIAATDDRLVVVTAEDPTGIAETAAEVARGDTESVLKSPENTEPTFERLESSEYVIFLPNLEDFDHLEFGDDVESIGVGFEQPRTRTASSGTRETEFVLGLAPDADVDDDWIVERLERVEPGEFVETSIDRTDGFVHVEAVVDLPPERDRDAAPDARVRAHPVADEGIVTFEHLDGESIDTDELEVWLDGELADAQLADEYDAFVEGDTFELETGPIADVGLRWFDEAEDVYYYYDTALVGGDSFEVSYDGDDTVEITYVGDRDVDPDRLRLVHRTNDGSSAPERTGIDDVSGSLTAGETITVEDVTLGDRVSLQLAAPANPNRGQRPLARYHVRPPRLHLRSRGEGVVARYYDRQDRAAEEFRVLVEDDPGDVQFADVTDTLSEGDEIELGDFPHGTSVAVEWLEPDDPVVVAETVVRPSAHIQLAYDDAEGTVTAEHVDGDPIAADDLELRFDGQPADDQPADEYETFEPGDELASDVQPFTSIELVWDGGEDVEHGLGRAIAGRESIEASYDPDAAEVELVYTGEQPADPDGLVIDHDHEARSGDGDALFAAEYETLSQGDGIVVEDVAPEDRITVMLVQDGENHVSHRSIFHFTPEPRWAFSFDERENGLVAIYRERTDRDADHFEILVDGDDADVQPSDRHETLSMGDEIVLGEFDAGTELTIEWTVPDEPREVTDHVVLPDAEFDFDHRPDDGTVVVEHAGGDEIAAENLGVVVEPTRSEPTGWDDHETVTEGDRTTVTIEETERGRGATVVAVVFQEHRAIAHERIDD
ncbi:hypothetical protein [Halosolutus halophilus]|uniref:hypothetical protein n=1 Tax=Halosolutus halophilus TaxID=1552990 RepID=UPI00223503E8|nr:hypothetical protein [Halosolutus halophilus]